MRYNRRVNAQPDPHYRALVARDARFDGVFYVGVSTTGIYCRPICTARTPRRERCSFFGSAAEAERAGFRACFRCRPELAPGQGSVDAVPRLLARAAGHIEAGFLDSHSVAELAAQLGVSARHLRRAMEERLGVSPQALAQSRRLAMAKRLLHDTQLGLAHLALASGFGSVRRFNAAFVARFGRPPSAVRRKLTAGERAASLALRLDARPPLDWSALLEFFAARAVPGLEECSAGEYRRVVTLGGAVGTVIVRADARRPALWAEVSAGLVPVVATAQTMPQLDEAKDFSAERFQLSSSRDGILNVESATVRSQGSWDVHLWMGDANDPLTLTTASDGERVGSLVKNRFGGELGGSMVVLPYLAVAIDLPLILAQDRDSTLGGVTTMLDDISGVGVGDLRISPKLRLLRRARSGVDLALRAQLTLPTGSTDNYRGEDGLSLSPSAMLSSRRGAMRWAVDLGYLMRRQTQVADLRVDDEVRLQLGGAYRVARPAEVGATLSVATAANDLFATAARNHSELSAGPSFEVGSQWVVFAAAGLGLQNGYGTPDWRALAGLRIGRLGAESVSDESDGDRDRLFGAADQCPGDAEDYDGFQDTDGCPDVDNDGDGVADVADRAPMEPEDKDGFQDDDGAPDPDNDGDGLADAGDQCPGERETQNGYQDGDGCPDQADGDGDGLADGQDACAEAAEDKDGFEDGDGCPDLDNDKDGVVDAKDRCPMVAGVADNGGCADTDKDGDAVVDRLDNCPDVKGVLKHQGCTGPQVVSISGGRIDLVDLVYFQTNKAVLQRRSFKLLDNVAEVINAHTEVSTLVVEGHTDNEGDDAFNLDLSQRRAEAVVAYLVKKGVDGKRLIAKGYGETQPVADNASRKGRAQNRRVLFKIDGITSINSAP